jgi:hypothetical protein
MSLPLRRGTPDPELRAAVTGRMATGPARTAEVLAHELGYDKPRAVLDTLNALRERGDVVRTIHADENGDRPVARWARLMPPWPAYV